MDLENESWGEVAYEAYRDAVAEITPMNGPWEGLPEWNKRAWIAAGLAARDA